MHTKFDADAEEDHKIFGAGQLKGMAEHGSGSLVRQPRSSANDQRAIQQLVTAPVVGHPVEAPDRERFAWLGPSFSGAHVTYCAF